MKSFFALIFCAFLLTGCSKEATTNSRLKGKWTVSSKSVYWYSSGSASFSPQYSEQPNYGTMEFDKKGKGVFIIPASTNVSEKQFDIKHSFEDVGEVLIFTSKENNTTSDTIGINWGWDKKSFTLIDLGMNNYNFNETIFSCRKQ